MSEVRRRPLLDHPPAPGQVLCGSMLYDLQFWSEAEWAALSGSERPAISKHVPRLGWVGAVAVAGMN